MGFQRNKVSELGLVIMLSSIGISSECLKILGGQAAASMDRGQAQRTLTSPSLRGPRLAVSLWEGALIFPAFDSL